MEDYDELDQNPESAPVVEPVEKFATPPTEAPSPSVIQLQQQVNLLTSQLRSVQERLSLSRIDSNADQTDLPEPQIPDQPAPQIPDHDYGQPQPPQPGPSSASTPLAKPKVYIMGVPTSFGQEFSQKYQNVTKAEKIRESLFTF